MSKFAHIFLCIALAISCNQKEIIETSPSEAKPFKHQVFTEVLEAHLSEEGMVNYAGLKEDESFALYINQLKNAHPDKQIWSREERLAYWINAYNAFTLQLILEHYPVASIKDIPNQWSQEFIKIEDKVYSLEQIEHQILRNIYKEPRIHFAINCASFSCPVLQPMAFEASTLEKDLEKVTFQFVNDQKRNKLHAERVQLSKIFKWFKADFTNTTSLIDYVQNYSATQFAEATKIEYLEYNWELNDYTP